MIDSSQRSDGSKSQRGEPSISFMSDEEAGKRLEMVRGLVAQPIPRKEGWTDPEPASVEGSSVLIGNKYHASDVDCLVRNGVTAILNCASGGISRLPMDDLHAHKIAYTYTNVRQDDPSYPILYDHKTGEPSKHLEVAKSLYSKILFEGGRVMFFCVAGQNRSAALAVAVLMLFGHSLEQVLTSLSKVRPFVLENSGFQRQLIELEAMLHDSRSKKIKISETQEAYTYASLSRETMRRSSSQDLRLGVVEVELLIPGLCTMDVRIPITATISKTKECLVEQANDFLMSYSDSPSKVATSWAVLASFDHDDMYDFPLETEAIEIGVQLDLMQKMFGLEVCSPQNSKEQHVKWTVKCRFALVIFSVYKQDSAGETFEEPWTFVHEERPGAPATFLEYNLLTTHLRAWDFVTGQSYASIEPIVFSFSSDPGDKRQFMRISTSANEPVQFHAPGEGGILGMGSNAVVHRVELGPIDSTINSREKGFMDTCPMEHRWDAAVKRHFSFMKMKSFLENRSEAGLAKRIRMASSLNSDGRVVEFYGLGVGLSSNSYNEYEYKFEAVLLAQYEEEFSTYTMKRFIHDFLTPVAMAPEDEQEEMQKLQENFSLISVKVLLVSLLNAFRDLTLMGVQAFDFNHLSNVLVSRDYRLCRLIDIDGDSKGSIQLDETADYVRGRNHNIVGGRISQPSLQVDLKTVLPNLVDQLILGKGRGRSFTTNKRSEIWRANEERAKELIAEVLRENFYPKAQHGEDEEMKTEKHIHKVTLWYYAVLKRHNPWGLWTRDIYDAMRCIDHLPIS